MVNGKSVDLATLGQLREKPTKVQLKANKKDPKMKDNQKK